MPVKVVTDSFSLIGTAFTILAVVVTAFVVLGLLRKTVFEQQKATNDALKATNDALVAQRLEMERELKGLRESYQMQERRIYRAELSSERQGRHLNQAREEIRLLEMMVNVAVPCLARLDEGRDEHARILTLLGDLTEYRRKSAREMDEWETTQTTTLIYLENRGEKGK